MRIGVSLEIVVRLFLSFFADLSFPLLSNIMKLKKWRCAYEKFNHLYLDSHERKLLIHSLVELKNQLIQQGRYTDCIDELIFKVINAPTKRMKIEYV